MSFERFSPALETLAAPASPAPAGPQPALSRTAARPASGVLADTLVLTREGFRKAHEIATGEALITRERGLQPVLYVTAHKVRTRMVHFAPEALSTPDYYSALELPAHQQVHLRDWRANMLFGRSEARVSAAALIDDAFVTDAGLREVTLYQLKFAGPATLYMGGLEVLSAHGFDNRLRPQF